MKYFLNFLLLVSFISLIPAKTYAVEELVLNSETSFNPSFENRFSFLLGVDTDLRNMTFSFGKKINDYWLDTNLMITNGLFTKMTTNNQAATGLTNDQLVDTKNTLTTVGLGIGRETRYIQTLLPFNDLYELMAADLTYNIYKETASNQSFTGPGMIAKFSMYKRFSNYVSAGLSGTYNLAVVKRSANDDTEVSSNRSLTMSYVTIGFDLSFFL
jgi:hypothetical protein